MDNSKNSTDHKVECNTETKGVEISKRNIMPVKFRELLWDDENAQQSLKVLRCFAEDKALKIAGWYLERKKWKKRFAQLLRVLVISLTTAGVIIPVVSGLERINGLNPV